MGRKKKEPEIELTDEQKEENKTRHFFSIQLIENFLKNPKSCNWANEVKVSKELYNINKELDFWFGIPLKNKLNSLVFFKTPDGKKYIDLQKKKISFNFEPPTKFEILPYKVGESKVIEKPKSLINKISEISKENQEKIS